MEAMKKCWFCKEEIPQNTKVCPWCGRRQQINDSANKGFDGSDADLTELWEAVAAESQQLFTMHVIFKEDILKMNTQDMENIVDASKDELRKRGSFQPYNLSIHGYDDDSRRLFEIPEVREWFRKVHFNTPFFPCLLAENGIKLYLLCLFDFEEISRQRSSINPPEQLQLAQGFEVALEVKSRADAEQLFGDVLEAGYNFFYQCGIGDGIAKRLMAKTMIRIYRLFPWLSSTGSK